MTRRSRPLQFHPVALSKAWLGAQYYSESEVMKSDKDPYYLQKLALKPFLENMQPNLLFDSLNSLPSPDKEALAAFIEKNFLGPLWLEVTEKDLISNIWTAEWRDRLQTQYRNILIEYARQLITIRSITKILDSYSIEHAVFKGAHIRESVYVNPPARHSCDIDLLVAEKDKNTVINLLQKEGFELRALPENITHEVSLIKNQIDLDLHWHIMRPGRVPKSLTGDFLKNRIRQKGYWSLNNDDNLFIMLTQPIFNKYLSLPRSSLKLFLDLIFWLEKPVSWDKVYLLLHKTGLLSAAWITLEYLQLLSGLTPPQSFVNKLTPHPLKQWYLRQWIHNDLPSRFVNNRMIPKLFFTLFAHDGFKDVIRFMQTLSDDRKMIRKSKSSGG